MDRLLRDCYPNGSYFRDLAITEGVLNFSVCMLPNSRGDRSNGGPVDCTSSPNLDPLHCITTDTPVNLTLYRPLGQSSFLHYISDDQLYKCCLLTN